MHLHRRCWLVRPGVLRPDYATHDASTEAPTVPTPAGGQADCVQKYLTLSTYTHIKIYHLPYQRLTDHRLTCQLSKPKLYRFYLVYYFYKHVMSVCCKL